jgi:peroxiredoxin
VGLPQPGDLLPKLELSDAKGRPASLPAGEVVYAFFKTTCPTCELAWPFLDRVRRAAEGGALSVVAVSQDGPEEAGQFAARTRTSIRTLFDPPPWDGSNALGLETVPTFLQVAADGRIRQTSVGFQKSVMSALAARAAQLAGRPLAEFFRPGESVPELRPG